MNNYTLESVTGYGAILDRRQMVTHAGQRTAVRSYLSQLPANERDLLTEVFVTVGETTTRYPLIKRETAKRANPLTASTKKGLTV